MTQWAGSRDRVGGLHHQSCPPARRRRPQKGEPGGAKSEDPQRSAARQALGRSRGGLTTKVHLAVDGRGLPLSIVLTPGNVNDSTVFDAVLDTIYVPRSGMGRPRRRPDRVLADKAYSSRAIRVALRHRGIKATIPGRSDQVGNRRRKGSTGGRRPAFDREAYKHRNVVERCFNRLKQFRAVATRFDKPATRYQAGLPLSSLILWLRDLVPRPPGEQTSPPARLSRERRLRDTQRIEP
ncbi:IS5 family transposase [Streptomyces sp. NPDC000609]|uniref:IS5 family transposase n=1 Tax=Streptomyces sp. NPDC000609 TaxID=3160957 RepID=UPI00339A6FA2